FVGLSDKKAVRRAERMDEVCYAKVQKYARDAQVLVFVQSRKDTVRTGLRMRDMAVAAGETGVFVRGGSAASEILREEAAATSDAGLRELLPFGLACHHAGMSRVDRQVVEELFAGGHIRALVSTATLAWGVNLPAHAVVIKGTQVYRPDEGRWGELSPQDVLQMLGRAGRPQFDSSGEGVIITTHAELRYYLSLLSQQLPIESQLVARLPDALNAEVAAGAVRSRADAVAWLGRTYLYVRMLRSPALYGAAVDGGDPALERRRGDLAHAALVVLERGGLVRYDRRGGAVAALAGGRVAADFYVGHRTLAAWRSALGAESGALAVLAAFAQADEFRALAVRADERAEVARLAERAPIPVRGAADPADPAAKAAVLVQAHVARLRLAGFALAADLAYVAAAGARLFRALFALAVARGWARPAREALAWARSVDRRAWEAETPLRQLRNVPPALLRAVERTPVAWARLAELGAAELGELVREPRAGAVLHALVRTVPRVGLRAHVTPLTPTLVRVAVHVTPDFAWSAAEHGAAERLWVAAEDAGGARLLHCEALVVAQAHCGAEHVVEFAVPVDPADPQIFVAVMSDRWVACDARLAVSFRHLRLPARAVAPTGLRDLAAVRDPLIERLMGGRLNAVQAQAFHALWATDDSVLLAAAVGAGKTRAADLPLIRFLDAEAERARVEGGEDFVRRRAVYVAPFLPLVRERADDWRRRLGALHGGTRFAVALGDDSAADLRLAEDAHVVLATPVAWDRLSRRWRQRQRHAVRDIGLFIADEVHLIGGAGLGTSPAADDLGGGSGGGGAVYEAVVSRTRFMAAQLDRPIRIVALS
ncbi:Pre-mRNA splicing, partial [Coemansia aciculifera]